VPGTKGEGRREDEKLVINWSRSKKEIYSAPLDTKFNESTVVRKQQEAEQLNTKYNKTCSSMSNCVYGKAGKNLQCLYFH